MIYNKFIVMMVAMFLSMFMMGEAIKNNTTVDNFGPVSPSRAEVQAIKNAKSENTKANINRILEKQAKQGSQAAPAGTVDNSPAKSNNNGKGKGKGKGKGGKN